jgi:RNA-directed DNA polymerase
LGHERRLDAHIVNSVDDFVICCRGSADEAMRVTENVNFLGYTIGLCH